jgi:glycosyltransferase involved in cell wall biosynthesis
MKTLMLAYSYYERDNRVRRYAETLVKRGDSVDVISLKQPHQPGFVEINGVKVYRIQSRELNEKGKLSYFYRIAKFFVKSAVILTRKHLREPYKLIHVHSVPDFEVFAALIPKLLGARVILDIHDLVPEFYCSKFGKSHDSLVYKLLIIIEKYSSLFADHVIASNHIWYRKLLERSVTEKNSTVILNYPDSSIFIRRTKHRGNKKLIIIYPGTLNWHQGLDIAIKAFEKIIEKVREAEFHIYGEGPSKPALIKLVKELRLDGKVFIHGMQPVHRIAEIMASADLGIVPKRNDPFGGEAFSTKILEFMSLGVPVIVSRTKIDAYYFNESIVQFFEPGNEVDLAHRMGMVLTDAKKRANMSQEALRFVKQFMWDNRKEEYLRLVDYLVTSGRS